ncbi:MAG: OmpA family protein [Turneriella sp.]|nr:OmpA family protein [Turneriella sp.]
MKRRSGLLLCLFALSCASAPEKKILKETDYQIWQKDLALRVSRESDNLQLRAELAEIALINEDFATALKTVRELMSKMPGDIRALRLREIEILRYSWQLDEALARLDAYVEAYPKDAATAQLIKRRPVIAASKALPAPLKTSPYTKNPFPGFSFAEVMQAPEVIYLDGPQKEIFADIKTLAAIDQNLWLKPLGKSPQISWDIGDDADIHHFPVMPPRSVNPSEPPGFVQNRGGTLTLYGAEGPEENLAFLQKRGCSLPAFSPWRDFFVASCKKDDHRDLLLFRRAGSDWQETSIAGNINTPFDELAPRISADGNYLFFASDGHPGYGAFDYYFARIVYNKGGGIEFTGAVNFGPQVNTFHNEVYPLQVSPLAEGIIFSAEGKEGLIGKATGGGLPRVQNTFSCRFIAYGENGAVSQPLTLTPLKGDARPAITILSGEKSPWLRLVMGAQYRISFRTAAGSEFAFNVKAPSNKEANFTIERFSVAAISSAIHLTYDDDVTQVTQQIRPEIEKAAARLKENPDLHVLIEGHADNIGGAGYNQGLSEKRAEAAKKQFMQLGIQPHRITTRGWGQDRPLNANSNKEERTANRRIEILLVR